MKHIENLVNDFLNEEEFSLRNALAYAGMGISKTTGQANEIISGVGFAEQQYSSERRQRMSEILGEMLFHWHVLASTVDIPVDEIVAHYITTYEATRIKIAREKITLNDMMEMKKHVKKGALEYDDREIEREADSKLKKRFREQMR